MIRPAAVGDADALAHLQIRAWHATYGGYVDAGELRAAAGGREARWRATLADPDNPNRTLVAADGAAAPLGFVSVGPSRDDDVRPGDGELLALYVDPGHTGHGLGARLLAAGEAELASTYAAATLWVLEPNTGARRFYERHGWRLDHAPFDRTRWSWAPSLRLRKSLRSP